MSEGELVEAARQGDGAAFGELVGRYRADLRLHCYRMLGSLDESEDMTQETLLRAWQAIGGYEGRAGLRTWLHRIATNACLDLLNRQQRRRRLLDTEAPPGVAVPWLQPYPDSLIEESAVSRETVELAFVAALQFLPDAQRAALILRDVLGWSAAECAKVLGVSVPAVNSSLQRARVRMRERLGPDRSQWRRSPEVKEAELLKRYMQAIESADDHAIAALLAPGARVGHQPGAGGHVGAEPVWYAGRETILEAWAPALRGVSMRMLATRANRQPAVATYLRVPGEAAYRAFSLTVLTIEEGLITELAVFGAELLGAVQLADEAREIKQMGRQGQCAQHEDGHDDDDDGSAHDEPSDQT